MPNDDKWNISNSANSPAVGNDLNGLRIRKTGSGYELYKVVATSTQNNPPVTFSDFNWDDQSWDLTASTLAPGQNGGGTWQTPASVGRPQETPPTNGDFTAQAGTIADPDEDADEAASSAKA